MGGIAIFLKVCVELDSMLSDHVQFRIQLVQFAYDAFELVEIAAIPQTQFIASLFMMRLRLPQSVDLISPVRRPILKPSEDRSSYVFLLSMYHDIESGLFRYRQRSPQFVGLFRRKRNMYLPSIRSQKMPETASRVGEVMATAASRRGWSRRAAQIGHGCIRSPQRYRCLLPAPQPERK